MQDRSGKPAKQIVGKTGEMPMEQPVLLCGSVSYSVFSTARAVVEKESPALKSTVTLQLLRGVLAHIVDMVS